MKTYLTLILIGAPLLLWSQKNREFTMDQSFNLADNGTIHMNTDDADVKITGTSIDKVKVVIYRKIKQGGLRWGDEQDITVDVYNRDGDLYISDRQNNGSSWTLMGYSYEDYRITIEAPTKASLEIKGDDDDYVIRNIHGDVDLTVDDGDVQLMDCRGSKFTFRIDDGDVTMNTGKGELYADIEDGDLEISNASFRELVAKSDDGNITLETSLNSLGNYKISCDDGYVELFITGGGGNFDIDHDDGRISASSQYDLIDKSEHSSNYKLPGGNASVVIRADDASIRLRTNKENN